jgi:hypothetical protein
MNKFSIRFLIIILTFIIGISSAAGWFYYQESQRVEIQLPNHRWEPIFFNGVNRVSQDGTSEVKGGINQATNLAGLKELRKTSLKDDDIEVRVWRGFGLSPLEAVILSRTGNQWSVQHLKTDNYYDFERVELKQLKPPKSGWEFFWKQIIDNGILTLRDPSETNCEDSGLDGMSYVVEINQNKIYRTYQMRSGGKCNGIQQMEKIGEIIGLEFDSGQEQCKTTEWFACMTFLKTRNQTNQ